MELGKIQSLLADDEYIAELLNISCVNEMGADKFVKIDPAWISKELSIKVTEKYQQITYENKAFLTKILVVCNPERIPFPYCVNDNSQRPRYIILTIIPDVPLSYQVNLPIILQMGVVGLDTSEIIRSTVSACDNTADVIISDKMLPPYLCNAKIEWVTIYVGKQDFNGLTKLSRKCEGNVLDGYEFDCHLIEARKTQGDPLLQKLIQAYDEGNEVCAQDEQN